MKKIVLFFMVIIMVLGLSIGGFAQSESISVYIDGQSMNLKKSNVIFNGKLLVSDSSPIIYQGTTIVPIRAIGESLNAEIDWNKKTNEATLTFVNKKIIFKVNSSHAIVNGVKKKIPSAPAKLINDGRIMVPLRFIADELGYTIDWNQNTWTANLVKKEDNITPIPQPKPDIKEKVIVIDAGHGGRDPGTTAASGRPEKEFNLEVTLKLDKKLRSLGYKTILTRDKELSKNYKLELEDRSYIANKHNADIFISIHHNAFEENPNVTGIESFYYPSAKEGKILAELIQKELIQELKAVNRGAKPNNFAVLRQTKMPAVLLELGFISNPKDEKIIETEDYQDRAVEAIARGLNKYFNR
ncbi:N-acetylmuramoyl-L-alanine amidase [Gottschalkia purinilytica]|uniref:N-acetylmuramoyl-L-alanine amidase n=1 Tax=Gottschalkia purinilytica TaxID=1503 RepID=A0A0L0WD47_GOTPU|nr:N-acetylmuramoyl-L-alanine amidase [Gottschalkia purinilytica]KNF09350.1 N-acetylmuramoyl-L-alanine amidase [Gottschalkia purinilytica]